MTCLWSSRSSTTEQLPAIHTRNKTTKLCIKVKVMDFVQLCHLCQTDLLILTFLECTRNGKPKPSGFRHQLMINLWRNIIKGKKDKKRKEKKIKQMFFSSSVRLKSWPWAIRRLGWDGFLILSIFLTFSVISSSWADMLSSVTSASGLQYWSTSTAPKEEKKGTTGII